MNGVVFLRKLYNWTALAIALWVAFEYFWLIVAGAPSPIFRSETGVPFGFMLCSSLICAALGLFLKRLETS